MDKVPRIQFYAARTLHDALRLKSEFGDTVEFLGGGTDLVLKLRSGQKRPIGLVQLPAGPEIPVVVESGKVRVSALSTLSALIACSELKTYASILAEALQRIGSPQVRNISTLGGNLVNACPACDAAPPLLCYEASLILETVKGARRLSVDHFFAGPGRTEIRPDEMLTWVEFAVPNRDDLTSFLKFGPRGSNVVASANLAMRIRLDGSRIASLRLAAGSVAPVPIRLRHTEAALNGKPVADLNGAQGQQLIAKALGQDISPVTDVRGSRWYKHKVIELSLLKALDTLANAAGQGDAP